MSDNFDDIEVYQASSGPVARTDPNFYRWILTIVSVMKAHFASVQAQVTASTGSFVLRKNNAVIGNLTVDATTRTVTCAFIAPFAFNSGDVLTIKKS